MPINRQTTEIDGEHLRKLIFNWCDGAIDQADLHRLVAALSASSSARQMFIETMYIHARLQGQPTTSGALSWLTDKACSKPDIGH
ncbi:MAG TPA: hypothetical protein VFE46_12845 [Pirellulales bacterium]|jgi:hypothetical protein|nr:hypothetical protein [Pirellulales bacterium]